MKRRSFLAAAVAAVLAPFAPAPNHIAEMPGYKSRTIRPWPESSGAEYHFWSPPIVDFDSGSLWQTNGAFAEAARRVIDDEAA